MNMPTALYGPAGKVRSHIRKHVRDIIEDHAWSRLGDLLPIETTPGHLLLQAGRSVKGEHFHLYALVMGIFEAGYISPDRLFESNRRIRACVESGLQYDWFNVALLAADPILTAVDTSEEAAPFAKTVLKSMLERFDLYTRLEDRFSINGMSARWPLWGSRLFTLCTNAQIAEEKLAPVRIGAFRGHFSREECPQRIRDLLS